MTLTEAQKRLEELMAEHGLQGWSGQIMDQAALEQVYGAEWASYYLLISGFTDFFRRWIVVAQHILLSSSKEFFEEVALHEISHGASGGLIS